MATEHDFSGVAEFLDEGHEYSGIKSERHPDGHTYRVPAPNGRTGLWLTTIAELGATAAVGGKLTAKDAANLQLDDAGEKSFYQRVLGPAWDEMLGDGVSWPVLQAVGKHAFLTFSMSQDIADAELAALAGKARARQVSTPGSPRSTVRKTAGSTSATGSGGTRARTRSRASTRSSTPPPGSKAEATG